MEWGEGERERESRCMLIQWNHGHLIHYREVSHYTIE
jgi:hypothetical protein